MDLSRRIRAFAGVVLFLSVLPAAYLVGEARGAHKAASNTGTTQASTNCADGTERFEPIQRLQRDPQKLNPSQSASSGTAGKWQIDPAPFSSSFFGPGSDPFAQMAKDMEAMQNRMDAVFGQANAGFAPGFGASFGMSDFGVEEKDGNYVVRMEAPGLDQGSLKVNVEDEQLSVSGTYRKDLGQTTTSSSFTRMSTLPGPVDPASVKTELKDGVLTITVKKQAAKGTRSLSAGNSAILN